MIANYTNHAANERIFLAWIRAGLAVAAFGLFLVELNVRVAAVDGGSLPRLPREDVGALVASRYAGLAIVQSGASFERKRRAIDSDEGVQIPCSVATFGGARDRRADVLHHSRGDLTFSGRALPVSNLDRRTL